MKAVAIDLAALGDTEPLWRDWLEDARRRFRVDVTPWKKSCRTGGSCSNVSPKSARRSTSVATRT